MKPIELAQECKRAFDSNIDVVMLTLPLPKNGVQGREMRTPFGLAEVANVNGGKAVVWVKRVKIEKWLAARGYPRHA